MTVRVKYQILCNFLFICTIKRDAGQVLHIFNVESIGIYWHYKAYNNCSVFKLWNLGLFMHCKFEYQ